ncbi:MAG: twin-arginine translocase TatA/TatE family subunit [Pirellulales bacterium]
MFGINHWELLIVLVIALVLFGHRLPSMMRSLGKSVTEFKKGVQGVEDEVESAGRDEGRGKSKSAEKEEARSDE